MPAGILLPGAPPVGGAGRLGGQLAAVGYLRVFDNVEVIFSTITSPVIDIRGCNSLMLVGSVTSVTSLDFFGIHCDPHTRQPYLMSNPHPVFTLVSAGPETQVWSWGAFTTLGGGPNQDTTMLIWEFLQIEVNESVGADTFVTLDLFTGKR
jgi:hypothetical protein